MVLAGNPPFAICHLPFAKRKSVIREAAVCHLRFGICHSRSVAHGGTLLHFFARGLLLYRRNIPILTLAQVVALSGSAGFLLLAGIAGAELAPSRALATLPISVMPVSLALFTIPAALLMQRFGRRAGFLTASLFAFGGFLLAAYALATRNFVLFCAAAVPAGFQGAFAQQYRFAATESVAPAHAGRAVSLVLIGGIVAGFLGPAVVTHAAGWLAAGAYTGSLVALAAMYLVSAVFFLGYRNAAPVTVDLAARGRPLREIARSPVFLTAVAGAATSYAVMSLIMTATPLELHTLRGYDIADTAFVIQSHVIAMFVPSLFSGFLIERFGAPRVLLAGAALLALTILGSLITEHFVHYWGALVLLGVGWNLQFVGSTVLLTGVYRAEERFKVQAVNDFTVFGTQAAASLSAGALLFAVGWVPMNLLALPLLAPVFYGAIRTLRASTAR